MRSVTRKIMSAFICGKSAKSKNTWTDGVTVYLHGNAIIHRNANGEITLSACGWFTPTTKERLNGFFNVANLPFYIYQRNFSWYVTKFTDRTAQPMEFKSPLTLEAIGNHFEPLSNRI